MNLIDLYLKKHNTTRYQVSKISGIWATTLSNANKNDLDTMSVKVIKALALGTNMKPGETLTELIELNGNPIIKFIYNHKNLNKEVVNKVEDLIIWHGLNGGSFNNISFNRYYDEGHDTDERAEEAIENVAELLTDFKEAIEADRKGTQN